MTQLTDPQTQAVLIRLCIIPRVTHLLRLMPDRIIRPLLEEFDAEIRLRFSEYSGASLDDDYARTRFHFPLRPGFGGFGQRSGCGMPSISQISVKFSFATTLIFSATGVFQSRCSSPPVSSLFGLRPK